MTYRIGIDVGGTFTDVTAFDDDAGRIALIRKYSSQPSDPMAVMDEILTDLADAFGSEAVRLILHGSTAALNTLLEDRGVATGLMTTAGFRDVYEIGRQWRGDDVFNLFAPKPKMLLPRDSIFEVRERLDSRGQVVTPLSEEDVERAAIALRDKGVRSVAICFLFGFANPAHERAAANIVRTIMPDAYVSLSSDVNPEWREYERTASTVANAYIGPPVAAYLDALQLRVHETFPACRALMMKSDGGAASARMLVQAPIQTVMSGPVAGVVGARFLGDLKQREKLITFDAGGTSSDMAVLPGPPQFKSEVRIGRHPLRTQTVDIETIGAGGGSIASIELGGVLKVGPRSAGARPGPACYARGGTEATLTDALVVLGHLSDSMLLGGAMDIEGERARKAVADNVAGPMKMELHEAAWGILTVLVTNCTTAMRTITVERGYDPREFTLIPFGGMGPTIAGRIAEELGIGRILVPADPGAFSAWGMLVTDVRQERTLTRLMSLGDTTPGDIDALFAVLEEEAIADLEAENFPRDRIAVSRTADMRYRGQSYEVAVPVGKLETPDDLKSLADAFHDAHARRYGHMAADESIEMVNLRVTAAGLIGKPELPREEVTEQAPPAPVEERKAWFGGTQPVATPVFKRGELHPGAHIQGPAIIEEQTSTIVVCPGHTASVDEYRNLEIEIPRMA